MKYSQIKELCNIYSLKPTDLDLEDFDILTDQDADIKCEEYVESLAWAFNPSFLSGITGIDEAVFKAIQDNDKCEDNNDAILSIIKGTCGIPEFIESAVNADGRGHFLSGYDGEENYLRASDGSVLYAYKIN